MENLPLSNLAPELPPKTWRTTRPKKVWFFLFGIFLILLFIYFILLRAPGDFPSGAIINISEGANVRSVSLKLQEERIIKSRLAFEAFIILFGGEKHIIPADYLFEGGEPVWQVARRIVKGDRHLAPVAVTIPEGFDVSLIADVFSKKLNSFNKDKFLLAAKPKEGYLFPDTYFFFSTDNEQDVLRLMTANFEKKVAPLRPLMVRAGKSEVDIIKMASLIEGEAKGNEDREFISGILWRRLAIGMPLQVDAALETYKEKGLPKNPICNPGLRAIKAAISPKSSPYLYYLHDADGIVHFAKSFAEHQANIKKYLK